MRKYNWSQCTIHQMGDTYTACRVIIIWLLQRHTMTKDNKKGSKPPKHWSQYVHEIVVSPTDDGSPNFTIRGGAENGLFPYVADIRSDRILLRSGKLHTDDIVVEVNGHKLPGFTLWDIEALLVHIGQNPLHIRTVKPGKFQINPPTFGTFFIQVDAPFETIRCCGFEWWNNCVQCWFPKWFWMVGQLSKW